MKSNKRDQLLLQQLEDLHGRAVAVRRLFAAWHDSKKDSNSDGLTRVVSSLRSEEKWLLTARRRAEASGERDAAVRAAESAAAAAKLGGERSEADLQEEEEEEEEEEESDCENRITSNLPYFEALKQVVLLERPIRAISKPFRYKPEEDDVNYDAHSGRKCTVRVDVVSACGTRWVKAVSRSTRALRLELAGLEEHVDSDDSDDEYDGSDDNGRIQESYDEATEVCDRRPSGTNRNVVPVADKAVLSSLPLFCTARSLLAAAKQNPVHYETPAVVFKFVNARRGVDHLVDEIFFTTLAATGVVVETVDNSIGSAKVNGTPAGCNLSSSPSSSDVDATEVYEPCLRRSAQSSLALLQAPPERVLPPLTPALNLDVTALLARLKEIASVVGGETERRRTDELFSENGMSLPKYLFEEGSPSAELARKVKLLRVHVVDDVLCDEFAEFLNPSDREILLSGYSATSFPGSSTAPQAEGASLLTNTDANPSNPRRRGKFAPKINLPNAIIYGTGRSRGETTVSSNGQICRSLAGEDGIPDVAIHLHEPRSLAEAKIPEWEIKRVTGAEP
ncbi:MAG: hypothetical protein BJ554DRAFT_7737 [Olpidium bornovanus]|uniref:Uncharacterized protein n=1 Tax=Olpidium bornovanus TaxID=278681 RepID=A0A8H8DJ49_9FUNG|nr:MAG: hypothetical protein BJ554DRAFT_7737 [Olpidium bornovanus]